MKLKSLPLGLLCTGGLLLASSQAPAQNLVNNPGFESQMTGWSTSTGSAVYTTTTNGVFSGTYSAHGVESEDYSLGRLYQSFTGSLNAGKNYKISGWIKTQDVTGAGVALALHYVGASGGSTAGQQVMEIARPTGTTDWTHYESLWFELPDMPADAVDLWLLFDFNAGAGTAFFDDVSLIQQPDVDDFVTTWKTDNPGTSSPTSITVPMVGGPYEVDWDNDGNFDETGLNGPVTHDFGAAGTYKIRVNGTYDSIRFEDGGDKEKILSLDQWGTRAWKSMAFAFQGAVNLEFPATDIPDFSAVTDMYGMFWAATSANPDTSDWDMAAVTNMSWMFARATSANPDTSGWDTSAVVHMYTMFSGATSANPDTSGWDTAAVANMAFMYYGATSANPDTSNWDTSAVTDMAKMFSGATSANPDTSGWNTSAVTDMGAMFAGATSANPDTSNWDTSAVTDMAKMFSGATSANPDTSGWNTSAVTDMGAMFAGATSANPDTNNWDTSAVTDMAKMFSGATSANPDTSGWDTGSVSDMSNMFASATSANPDTSGWDTAAVLDMSSMFYEATSANPNTSGWDTSAVTDMSNMFYFATSANPDTSGWNTSAATTMSALFGWATSANPDTSGWDTSAVISMREMFIEATSANPDTSGWDTSAVTDMVNMFRVATSANPDTSGWDTSSVTDMGLMFDGATSANPDTSGWDTSAVTRMSYMFAFATSANPDTSSWDTSAVISMNQLFRGATSANPDTSKWDTSSVETMIEMFQDASSFDQDLGSWNVMALIDATDMFAGVTLSTANYESLLTNWNAQVLKAGVTFSGGNSTYCTSAAIAARDNMISSDSWVITDGGQFCNLIFKDGFEPLLPQLDCPCFDYDNAVAAARPDRLWFNCFNETDPRRKEIFSAEIADPFGYFDRLAPFDYVEVTVGGNGWGECYSDGDDFVHWATDPDIPGDLERLENCASIIDDVIDEYTLECETDYYSCVKRVRIRKPHDIVFEGDTVTINGVLINHPPESCLNNAPIAKVIWWWWDGPEVFEPNPNDGYVYTFPNSHTTSVPGSVAVDVIAYDATGRVIAAEIVSAHAH